MIDLQSLNIEELEDFIDWYRKLGPDFDMHEAMTIFFNQETYGESI